MFQLQQFAAPLGRLLLGFMFIFAGFKKIGGYAGTAAYMESKGVPGMLLPLVILLEAGGGIAIVAGFQARIVAFLMAGFCVLAAAIFHPEMDNGFWKNISIAGGFLMIFANGAGAYSVDAKQGRR